jgi:tight adherence protein C
MNELLSPTGALIGLAAGLGLVLAWRGLPRHRRAGLAGRLHPYLQDAPPPSRLLARTTQTAGVLGLLLPVAQGLASRLDTVLGSRASVRRRLLRAGRSPDTDRFRAEQLLWGAGGAVVAGAFVALRATTASVSIPTSVFLVLLAVAGGCIAKDQHLSMQANAREQLMLAEFPSVAELLALAVSAGEGAVGALERVVALSRGELSSELARCLADARAGANLQTALQGLADRTGLPSLARFVDGIVVAMERGTPLAEVLRAQAQDVREDGKRALVEAGGRKEIAMMVPVVFLILPITVVFALFPGFSFLKFDL